MELTAALNNLNNDGSSNLAVGIGAKKSVALSYKVQWHQRNKINCWQQFIVFH
jgi:hypothetical protein